MTKLIPGHPVVRETGAYDRADPIVVELHNTYLVIRIKGGDRERRVEVTYAQLLSHGGKLPGRRP